MFDVFGVFRIFRCPGDGGQRSEDEHFASLFTTRPQEAQSVREDQQPGDRVGVEQVEQPRAGRQVRRPVWRAHGAGSKGSDPIGGCGRLGAPAPGVRHRSCGGTATGRRHRVPRPAGRSQLAAPRVRWHRGHRQRVRGSPLPDHGWCFRVPGHAHRAPGKHRPHADHRISDHLVFRRRGSYRFPVCLS